VDQGLQVEGDLALRAVADPLAMVRAPKVDVALPPAVGLDPAQAAHDRALEVVDLVLVAHGRALVAHDRALEVADLALADAAIRSRNNRLVR